MKKIKQKIKFILMTFCFVIVLAFTTNAYIESEFTDVYHVVIATSQYNDFYYDQDLNLYDVNVKGTQDDNYYYLDITAKANIKDVMKNRVQYKTLSNGTAHVGYRICYNGVDNLYVKSDMQIPLSLDETDSICGEKLQPLLYSVDNFTRNTISRQCYFEAMGAGQYNYHNQSLRMLNKRISYFFHELYDTEKTFKCRYETDYKEHFYFPHPFKLMKCGYDSRMYNPNTGRWDVDGSSSDAMLKHQDGVKLLSHECSVDSYTLNGSYINSLVYNLKSNIRIDKDKMHYYRYIAYGGPVFLLSYKQNSDYSQKYYGVLSTTGTYDLKNDYDCEHEWHYTNNDDGTHTKRCAKCEWTIKGEHDHKYEYDGIEENLCECGDVKKVKYYYHINDDVNTEEEKIYDVGDTTENVEYEEKTGYRFLHYEKYEKEVDTPTGNNYSTRSNAIRNVLIATVSTMDRIAATRSVIYKAIYDEFEFTVRYSTERGDIAGVRQLTKKYKYTQIKNLETVMNTGKDWNFKGWAVGNKLIKTADEMKQMVVRQGMSFDLKAVISLFVYSGHESGATGPFPGGGGNGKKKELSDEEKNKIFEEIKEKLLEEILNNNLDDTYGLYVYTPFAENADNSNGAPIVYEMSRTDFEKVYNILNIGNATPSEITKATLSEIEKDETEEKESKNMFETILGFLKEHFIIIALVAGSLIMFFVTKHFVERKAEEAPEGEDSDG